MDKYFYRGKYFETFEQLQEYIQKWPDEPLDLLEYREFLDEMWREAKLNLQIRGLTNRQAYRILKMNTDWADGKEDEKR